MVRDLTLVRRRSRVPWIYVVYHPREGDARGRPRITGAPGVRRGAPARGAAPGRRAPSALPAEKGRHVERRVQIEAVLLF